MNNVEKIVLALSLSYLSEDMSVNIIRIPKLHNKFVMTIENKNGKFSKTVPLDDTNKIDNFLRDVVNHLYKKNHIVGLTIFSKSRRYSKRCRYIA